MRRNGFTMVELLLAVMIMSVMMVIAFFTFNTVVRNWTKSMELVDKIQYADYALTQIVSGLRSAYFPTDAKTPEDFGFQLYDDGDKEDAHDTISWAKLGSAIIGNTSRLVETPHRVRIYVEDESRDGPGGLMVQATPDILTDDQKEEMEDEKIFQPYLLVQGVTGFNCRVADYDKPFNDDGSWNWQDEWSKSNCIPRAVELTFYLQPSEKGAEPESVMRVVEIPLWYVSQNVDSFKGSNSSASGAGGAPGNGGKSTGKQTSKTGGQTPVNGGQTPGKGGNTGGSRFGGGGLGGGAQAPAGGGMR